MTVNHVCAGLLRKSTARSILLVLLSLLASCASGPSHETPYIKEEQAAPTSTGALRQRLILLGDAGDSTLQPLQASLQLATNLASREPEKTSVILLGDNIYFFGFPNNDEDEEAFSEGQLEDISHLEAQLQIAKLSGSEVFVVPGNHDWYAGQVDSQADYIEQYAKEQQLKADFVPHQAGSEPLPEIVHRDGVSLVFLDSMWMIKATDAEFSRAIEHLDTLARQSLQEHPHNLLVISAHHPVETMGPHNKYYTTFIYRAVIGVIGLFVENDQDLDHPRYQRFVNGVESVLAKYPKSIFAAGHDHSLQVFGDAAWTSPRYRLVSGAANTSMVTGVGASERTLFALAQEGLMVLDVLDDGIRIAVYDIHQQEPVFERVLFGSDAL